MDNKVKMKIAAFVTFERLKQTKTNIIEMREMIF